MNYTGLEQNKHTKGKRLDSPDELCQVDRDSEYFILCPACLPREEHFKFFPAVIQLLNEIKAHLSLSET